MAEVKHPAVRDTLNRPRPYRAITRHNDGRIIHVRDIQASGDAEAIRIVTERGADIRTDLYGEDGLVQRFGIPQAEPVPPLYSTLPD